MTDANPVDTQPEMLHLSVRLKEAYNLRTSDLKRSILLTTELLHQFTEAGSHHLTAAAKNHLVFLA